jgi:hypothetical protein
MEGFPTFPPVISWEHVTRVLVSVKVLVSGLHFRIHISLAAPEDGLSKNWETFCVRIPQKSETTKIQLTNQKANTSAILTRVQTKLTNNQCETWGKNGGTKG